MRDRLHDWCVARRELVRARDLRSVWHNLPQSSRPSPDSHGDGWGGASAAQGLSGARVQVQLSKRYGSFMRELTLNTDTISAEEAEQTAAAPPETTGRRMTLNMGPQHPSTHGVLRVVLELDGETIITAVPDIGFLHTGIEKECEVKTWQQAVTLTDRVDYLANLSNNLVYALSVEKLIGDIEIPPKAQWLRVMMAELSRLNSHLVWLGTHALDIGAMTVFFYCFREREDILRIFEMFSGQRMMTSYIRIGGVAL